MFIAPPAITPTNIIGGCIAQFENVWTDIEKTIKTINKQENNLPYLSRFAPATAGSSPQENLKYQKTRTNSHFSLTHAGGQNDYFRDLNNRYFFTLLGATQWYKEHYGIPELFHNEPYNLLRYQTGQEYKAHYDGGIHDKRIVSPILYLNDNYKGGELEFVHFGIKIKPTKGSLYLFPSNYAYSHIAHPVTEGTKYAIVTWLHGVAQ
jgi:Rps23 Pro-64 3,4-dihydroxylase Tpa1-like proline 4-hydroxylase